jgi:hypothetical protein
MRVVEVGISSSWSWPARALLTTRGAAALVTAAVSDEIKRLKRRIALRGSSRCTKNIQSRVSRNKKSFRLSSYDSIRSETLPRLIGTEEG